MTNLAMEGLCRTLEKFSSRLNEEICTKHVLYKNADCVGIRIKDFREVIIVVYNLKLFVIFYK